MTDFLGTITGAALLLIAQAHAEPLSQAGLSALLNETPRQVDFTETRHSTLLVEPLRVTGHLTYEAPDRLIRRVETPASRIMILTRDVAILSKPGGDEQRIGLESQPALQVYARALRGLLSGNLDALREDFELSIDGEPGDWRLDLVPLDPAARKLLNEVEVTGEGSTITQIEVTESPGEWTVIELARP